MGMLCIMSGTVSNHDALQVPVQGCCGLLTGAVRNEMMLSGACAGMLWITSRGS